MSEQLKKLYYKLPEKEFNEYLNKLKNGNDTVFFFSDSDKPYFYHQSSNISSLLIKLHEDLWEFDRLFEAFTDFGRRQIIQSFLIDEVHSTNSIENISSTRHDIFYLMNNLSDTRNKKLMSILNAYRLLIQGTFISPVTPEDLRSLYDEVLKGTLEKKDIPDGRIFRKEAVSVSDGTRDVHEGFYPERKIYEGIEECLSVMNDEKRDIFERQILTHFLLETVHPFYDGNGRLGRFLFTQELYKHSGSYLSFEISAIIERHRSEYYRMFKNNYDVHEFGCLNAYVEEFAEMLHAGMREIISGLEEKRKIIEEYSASSSYTKSQKMVLSLLTEATLLSHYGVSNNEILDYLGISKRTLMSCMDLLRKQDMLEEYKTGKTVYHKLKVS